MLSAVRPRFAVFAMLVACPLAVWSATFGRVFTLVGGGADLVLDEARGRVYLTSSNTNQLQIFSIAQQRFLTPVLLDTLPLAMAISRSGKFLYVACYNSSTLDVVDLDALAVTNRVSLPARPEGVAVGRDERVLISTSGSGVANSQNVLLRFDPAPNATNPVVPLALAPPVATPPTLPAPSGRAFLSARSQLVATRDGSTIIGVNLPNAATRVVFVYEAASGVVLRSRAVTGTSSVLSISDDGTRFMSGPILFETATLTVLAQLNTANSPYPFPANANFNLQSNQGGSVFTPDGQTLYSAFDIAPVGSAANASQMMANDPDNLLIRSGYQLPENLVGKMAITADGATIYALSDSGLVVLPVSTISRSPLAVPATDVVLLTNDQCGVTSQTFNGTVAINNPGTGRITTTAQLLQAVAAGPVPSPATAPTVRSTNSTSASQVQFTFNTAAARGVGTVTPPHDFLITSPEAINIPDRIRVYENNRDADARGTILPIVTGTSSAEQLEDLIYDQPRQRLYIANSGMNRVEVFDIRQNRLLAPVKVGQLPRSMALSPEGAFLYVANSGGESISIIDPDKLQVVDRVLFPPIPFNANLALSTPRVIAASQAGLMIFVGAAAGNGALWKVAGNTAVPRGVSAVIGANAAGQPNPIPAPVSMAATPAGDFVLVATTANAYLYDPLAEDFVQGRAVTTVAGYLGPIAAGPRGQYFVVNGQLLNSALVPVGQGAAAISQVSSIVQAGNTTFARSTQPARPAAANTLPTTAPTVDLVDATTGATVRSAAMLEGPQTALPNGGGVARLTIGGRTMAIDAAGTTAYVITTSGLSIVPLAAPVASDRPLPANRGTVNIGSYQTQISPNGVVSIFGQNLGQLEIAGSTPLPVILGGTCVTLNNIALPLFMVSPAQINAQIPPSFATGSVPLVVRSVAKQIASAAQNITVSKYAPAVIVSPEGQVALFHANGKYVTKDDGANRDEPLTMYAVGLGNPTSGRVSAGTPSPLSPLAEVDGVQVFFGRTDFVQSEVIVDWSGLSPGLIGVYQMNLRVPGFHTKGDSLLVTIRIAGVDSPSSGPVVPFVSVN